MNRLIVILLIIQVCSISAYELHLSIKNPDNTLENWAVRHNFEITSHKGADRLDLVMDEKYLDYLAKNHYRYQILASEIRMQRDIDGYRNYEDVTAELAEIAADHPEITELSSFGNSTCYSYFLDGNENYSDFQHQVWCLKLSDQPEINEDEPNIFFAAEIHAREPISLEVDMHVLNYLVSNYGIVDSVTNWIDETQIWFIPLMNPDGHKVVTEGWHTMHRKNMRDNDVDGIPDFSTTDGVDLNRNFGYVWGDNGASNNPGSSTYHGPEAWSEIETVYARNLLREYKFFAGITYHSSGQYVLYPLGHLPNACSYDHEIMHDLAVKMANTIPQIDGSGHYLPIQAVDFGYTCQGTMGDWGYSEERIFAYTIELATSFIPPAYQVPQICEDNLQAALLMLDRVNHSTVTGLITKNGAPIQTEIYVSEIDFEENMSPTEPVRNDVTFGRYYRLLLPGEYTFTFESADGDEMTVENVLVSEDTITTLDIEFGPTFLSNDEIVICVDDHYVILDWNADPLSEDLNYTVYSSNNPYTDFEIDSTGVFIEFSKWRKIRDAEKEFYIIRYE